MNGIRNKKRLNKEFSSNLNISCEHKINMKKQAISLLIAVAAAFFLLSGASAGIDKHCYHNYSLIKCGDQPILIKPDFCQYINITINECFIEDSKLHVIFDGIEYFEIPHDIYQITVSLQSRDWLFIGTKNAPLPEKSKIEGFEGNKFLFLHDLGNRSVDSVQITVPFCYDQLDNEQEKIYPRAQAGKKCLVKKPAEEELQIFGAQETDAAEEESSKPNSYEKNQENEKLVLAKEIVLVAVAALAVIIGILALLPRRKKQKGSKTKKRK